MNLIVEREKSIQALEDRLGVLRGRGASETSDEVRQLAQQHVQLDGTPLNGEMLDL